MKQLHWILFCLAAWILVIPFIGDDLIEIMLGANKAATIDLVKLLRWDDFFLGLAIVVLALIILTLEQASHKTPGLKAMHWMQVVIGLWITVAPFALTMDYEAFTWSHFVSGGFVIVTSPEDVSP